MFKFSKFTSILFFVGFSFALVAQPAPRDRIVLTDGTTYSGIVIEQKPGEFIRFLRLPQSDTLTVALENIERLIRLPDQPVQTETADPVAIADPGKFNTADLVLMIHGWTGGGDYALAGFGLGLNHRVNPRLEAGLAVHYLGWLYGPSPERYIIPLTANMRYRLTQSKSGRFASLAALNAGYSFTLNNQYYDPALETELVMSNGFYFNPALGFSMNVLQNAGLMIEIGYQMTTSNLRDASSGETLRRKMWHNLAVGGTLFF